MSESEFLAVWRKDLALGNLGLRLADANHPLEIFVGVSDLGKPRLSITSHEKPKEPLLSKLVLVDRFQGKADQWHLTMTLQDPRFTEVFLKLCDDLVVRSGHAASETEGLRLADKVLDEWRRLLVPRRLGLLTLDELRGLIGELWLVLNEFTGERSIIDAIHGWFGPLGAPQDFWYAESGFHESKSIGPTSTGVKISSENQLDAPGNTIELIVLVAPTVAETSDGALNLIRLVDEAKHSLDSISESYTELELRLEHLGVDLSEPFYADTWFTINSLSTYDVTKEFPAIRASDLPAGVDRVRYRIGLNELLPFRSTIKNLA